jgi:hypothetical protein
MKLFFILFFILLIPFSSSMEVGVSPGVLVLEANQNELVCKNFSLIGQDEIVFLGDLFWSKVESRNINDYKLKSEDMGIEGVYPKNASPGKNIFCIKSKKEGNYHGVLKYKIENTNYGFLMWLDVNIEKDPKTKIFFGENPIAVTRKIINPENKKIFAAILWIFSLILISFFLFLLLKINKLKRRNLNNA